MNNRRGQAIFNYVMLGIVILFIGAVGWAMIFDGSGFAQAVSSVTDTTINAIGPFFKVLLGSSGDVNIDFLKIFYAFTSEFVKFINSYITGEPMEESSEDLDD